MFSRMNIGLQNQEKRLLIGLEETMINNVLIRDVHMGAQFIESNSLNFWLIRKINYKIQLNTCKFNNEVKKDGFISFNIYFKCYLETKKINKHT